jgi:hypothetical protein
VAEPIRLLRGEEGVDSPVLDPYDDTLDADRWHAWLTIGADRANDRPTDRNLLAVALDVDEPVWMLWWDRPHPDGGLTHRAERIGNTLVSACGYSQPWDPGAATFAIGNRAIRDSRRTYCAPCLRIARDIL